MPEGPSILILKEEAAQFEGKKIVAVTGNSKLDIQRLEGQKIIELRTWGKHFILCFKDFSVRIHLMLFGSYSINMAKEGRIPRLGLCFKNGELNFYACSVKFIEGDINAQYDWSADVLSDLWDADAAKEKITAQPNALVCDTLLNQDIFAGVGNIIKNEVLWRIRLHPLSIVSVLPDDKVDELVAEARNYSFDFLKWKKNYELKKHYQVHTKKICPRDGNKLTLKILGVRKRRAFYCEICQVLYT